MVLDHIAIVVQTLDRAIEQWQDLLGYRQSSAIIANARQKVRVVFLTKDRSVTLKLIEPFGADSPIANLAKRGGGLHHLCFRCDDVSNAIDEMVAKGARVLVSPEPGEAFGNHAIAFLLGPNNVNLELIDTSYKEGLAAPRCES